MYLPTIIAEVKTKSPWKDHPSDRSWRELFQIAVAIGDMVAVHTSPEFGGSWHLLRYARKLTCKPLVAKGLHPTDDDVKRAFDWGANWVLVVGRVPRVKPYACLIEPRNLTELHTIPNGLCVVWNARNLETGERKCQSFKQARQLWPRPRWLCQASYIKTHQDISSDADAILVGTHLVEFARSLMPNMSW